MDIALKISGFIGPTILKHICHKIGFESLANIIDEELTAINKTLDRLCMSQFATGRDLYREGLRLLSSLFHLNKNIHLNKNEMLHQFNKNVDNDKLVVACEKMNDNNGNNDNNNANYLNNSENVRKKVKEKLQQAQTCYQIGLNQVKNVEHKIECTVMNMNIEFILWIMDEQPFEPTLVSCQSHLQNLLDSVKVELFCVHFDDRPDTPFGYNKRDAAVRTIMRLIDQYLSVFYYYKNLVTNSDNDCKMDTTISDNIESELQLEILQCLFHSTDNKITEKEKYDMSTKTTIHRSVMSYMCSRRNYPVPELIIADLILNAIMIPSTGITSLFTHDPKKMFSMMISSSSQKLHPLHLACQENLYYLTRVILNAISEYDLSINIPNPRDNNRQPLDYAYENCNIEILKLLLSYKVQPHVGRTVLLDLFKQDEEKQDQKKQDENQILDEKKKMLREYCDEHNCNIQSKLESIVYANVDSRQLMINFNCNNIDLKKNDQILSLNEYEQLFYSIMPNLNKYENKKLNLLFHARKDGFSASNFHQKCDGRSPTITVIMSTNDNIYGGFTDIMWEAPIIGEYKSDKFSFIFAKPNKKELTFLYCSNSFKQGIYCSKFYGPTYGDDLCLSSDCNDNEKSYWYQGNLYGDKQQNPQKTFFKVKDYQVFTLQ